MKAVLSITISFLFFGLIVINSHDLFAAEGTIKRLTDKGFGFIEEAGTRQIYRFVPSKNTQLPRDLRVGDKVLFELDCKASPIQSCFAVNIVRCISPLCGGF